MIDKKYELKKHIKIKFKLDKKRNIKSSEKTQKEIDILLENANSNKLEIIYKYKCIIFNDGINIKELDETYIKLFRKILFTADNSCMFSDKWDNIFTSVFGNIPTIYMKHGKDIINKIIDSFYMTKNEAKIKVLMKLFKTVNNIEKEDIKYIDLLLNYINKTDINYLLKSYEDILDNLSSMCDNITFKKENIEKTFELFSKSKNKNISENLSNILTIFVDNLIENEKLYEFFELVCISDNNELIAAVVTLLEEDNFRNLQSDIQDRCITILKNIQTLDNKNSKLITKIILDIIVSEEEKIQKFLLNKLETIKNKESLELILKLTPLLNEFIDNEEYIRVIDGLEDEDKNMTKKLTINLNYNK